MISKRIVINDEKGLHMRPAKDISQIAVMHDASIRIKYKDGEYNAKSLISLLGAGIKGGSEIEIICVGEDEEKLMKEIENYFEVSKKGEL